MYLDSTTKIIEAYLNEAIATTNPTYVASYNDHTTTSLTPGDTQGSLNGVSVITLVGAPAAATQRQVTHLMINNIDTIPHVIYIEKDVSGSNYLLFRVYLEVRSSLQWTREGGWRINDTTGNQVESIEAQTYKSQSIPFLKNLTAPDAAGYWYCASKDGFFPSAWAPGTPGVAGRATDGTLTADAGCMPIDNAATGSFNYLRAFSPTVSATEAVSLFDILWVNSGLVVTTTTAQNVNSVALPPRDNNGSTNGEGVMIGALAVGALGNAAVNNTATISYTNSDGTAGRTATLLNLVGAQFPATPVIGTVVWFLLAAGDKGVRSIETITLATTLTSGTLSLIMARPIITKPGLFGSLGKTDPSIEPGIKLYNGTCMILFMVAAGTSASVVGGNIEFEERS